MLKYKSLENQVDSLRGRKRGGLLCLVGGIHVLGAL